MATILENIVGFKKKEIEEKKKEISLREMETAAEESEQPRNFRQALGNLPIACIAEIKKASPSRGVLTNDFHPGSIACDYSTGGASAISVLTERKYFQGYPEAIKEVRKESVLPVLRKDFIVDEYQIYESRMLGADAILLIVNLLDHATLVRFLHQARSLQLECLVECHNENEIRRAIDAGADIIGINNRDLHTFQVSIENSFRLRKKIPQGHLCVSESGIKTHEQVMQLQRSGFNAILVGEQFMTAPDRIEAMRKLLQG